MKKFYRYLIYRLYSWGLKKKGDTPIANVILTISFVHLIQLIIILMVCDRYFISIEFLFELPKGILILILVAFPIIHYFLFYNKARWQKYLVEFKDEGAKSSKRGTILVLGYLIGSLVIFFVLLPLLFGI